LQLALESFACSRHKKQTHLQYSKHISLLAIAAVALLAATIVSKTWVIDVPARVGFFTAHQTDVPTTRLLRAYGASNEDKEERVGLSGLIQAGTSKIDDLVMSRKYKSLVKKLQLDDGFVAVLKKPHLENLNQLVSKFNRGKKLKKQISRFQLSSETTQWRGIGEKRGYSSRIGEAGEPIAGRTTDRVVKKDKSVDDVFVLLKLSVDGYKALRSRKLQVLEDYITRCNRR
ncbi:hypothetical protein JG688_00011759, partial [Phytophthora aleatoria]